MTYCRLLKIIILLFFLYCMSYFYLSRNGHYRHSAFGLASDEYGNAKLSPKKSIPKIYYPFDLYDSNDDLTLKFIMYYPLVIADQQIRRLLNHKSQE